MSQKNAWIKVTDARPVRSGPYELLLVSHDGPVPTEGSYSASTGAFFDGRGSVSGKVIAWRRKESAPRPVFGMRRG